MDKQNERLKNLPDRLTYFITEDWVAESTMFDVQEEVDHGKEVFPIKRKSPSFEAQDPLEEVNLGDHWQANDNHDKWFISQKG